MIFWFVRLFAAHLLADFVFQFGFVYRLKVRGPWGLLLHTVIVAAIAGVVLGLFLPHLSYSQLGIALFVVGITHFSLDWLKAYLKARGHYEGLAGFLGDQLSHTAVLMVIAAWLLPSAPMENSTATNWPDVLLNDLYWWILVGSILVTYLVGFTLFYLEGQPTNAGSPIIGRYSGFWERLAIFGLVALGPFWSWVLLPAPTFLRGLYLTQLRQDPLPPSRSLLLGPLLAALTGAVIRAFFIPA